MKNGLVIALAILGGFYFLSYLGFVPGPYVRVGLEGFLF